MAYNMKPTQEPWQAVVERKRKQQQDLLRPWLDLLHTTDGAAVTDIDDAAELVQILAGREKTAVDVTKAYIRQALIAHQKTNCLTEICFERALERAEELDKHLAKHKSPLGPLHGVPVTLKDQFNVKDFDTTLGYVGRAFKPAGEDAVYVHLLEAMGAVVIAKTNLPQSIMWCETENPLWGLTVNPSDASMTPGGSSGGEGACLAMHGSLIGLGTDIGGSIRIPSHICGLYGLKPSSGRLPYHGLEVSTAGQQHVPSVVGPLARSLSSILLMTKETINLQPWLYDPQIQPLPWRQKQFEDIQSRPLVIGVITDDGVVKVHPPIERVLREVCEKLEKAGHELVPWDTSGHDECVQIMDQYYLADGFEDVQREVVEGGEPFIPHVQALVNRAHNAAISVYDYWQLNQRKVAVQQRQLKKWNDFRSPRGRKVDVLISPTMPHSAVRHRGCKWVGYTKVWNVLDYTALVLPAGAVSRELDELEAPKYEPRNDIDRWNWALYDRNVMEGHPISVQIIGRRLDEEVVLGAAIVIEKVMKA